MNCIVNLASVVGGEKTVSPTDKKQAPPGFARQSAFARYRLGIKTMSKTNVLYDFAPDITKAYSGDELDPATIN